ncbi:uncharacterized protein MYCFIDRAFT_83253 [Pseudocercospora fijiensis CIRAD86]|uniref:Uncharacterized protein n=1 Tax=Pseudocercospora fijiensis (strain CIRAD86) TaxID=383855 RepID=M3AIM6_PSEFD|nr:uncharacterized protein MYCFIDRAFT_83253 [Pseudocercospora fijiensis CIRAD86]EME77307.1 hypothetical protein MYCFIDRAFT_83253 [Pseudocercospora fijiensis CIRAD86]
MLVVLSIFLFWLLGAFTPDPGPPAQDDSVVWSLGHVAEEWFIPIPAQFYVEMDHAIAALENGGRLRAVLPQAYTDSRELLRFCADFRNHSASIEHRIKQDVFLRASSDLKALRWDLTRYLVSSQQAKTWYGRWSEEGWRKAGLGLPAQEELRQNIFDGIYEFLKLQSNVVNELWWASVDVEWDAALLWQAYKLNFTRSVEEVESAAHEACVRDYEIKPQDGRDQDAQDECDTINPHGFLRDADLLKHERQLDDLKSDAHDVRMSLEKWQRKIPQILTEYRQGMGRSLTTPELEARWRAWVSSMEEQELERKRNSGELPAQTVPAADTTTTITWA